jgi:hypothetical protein
MVGLVDDQQVQDRHLIQIAHQRLDHREGGLARPGFLVGIEHRRR